MFKVELGRNRATLSLNIRSPTSSITKENPIIIVIINDKLDKK